MGEMLAMQQPGEIFPDGCKVLLVGMSLVGVKEPTKGQYDECVRKEPGGNDNMGEACQVSRKRGGGECQTTVRICCMGIRW